MWTTLLINLVSTVQKTQMTKKFAGRWRFCITIRTSETRLKFEFKKNWRNRVFCLNSDRKRTKNRGKTEHRSADRTKRGSEIRSLFFQKKNFFLLTKFLNQNGCSFNSELFSLSGMFWQNFLHFLISSDFKNFTDFQKFSNLIFFSFWEFYIFIFVNPTRSLNMILH